MVVSADKFFNSNCLIKTPPGLIKRLQQFNTILFGLATIVRRFVDTRLNARRCDAFQTFKLFYGDAGSGPVCLRLWFTASGDDR
jgi:hypothetical protein